MNGACEVPAAPCSTDEDCEDDTRCECATGGGDAGPCAGGLCRPWGPGDSAFDPSCDSHTAFLAFKPPIEKCHWLDGDVVMTPLVLDLDGDHRPEIVFSIYSAGTIIAIHGDTCKELWRTTRLPLGGEEQIAAADLDNDGFPEIVVSGAKLIVLDHTGQIMAETVGPDSFGCCGGPAIADVDGKAPAEIGINGSVYRYENGQLTQLWSHAFEAGTWGTLSLFADMDGNGTPELVTGLHVYDGLTGKDKTPPSLAALGAPGGYAAVADFNKDGKPDIVIVQSARGQQRLSIVDFAGNKVLFGPYTVQGGGWGGPPTVDDYDGDGVPDIGVASQGFYYVYALKCGKRNKPKDCTGTDEGVLWQRKTHDLSSGGTSSSTFDFNGDGISEVVYRDECWLRVYNGPDGKTLFARAISSGTALEYPIVADVNASGHASIIVPSDNIVSHGCPSDPEGQLDLAWAPTRGVFVLADPMNRWMPSRPVWHQHTYHITEIGDDLKVPAHEKSNWLTWNNYRKNVQGSLPPGAPAPDFTGGVVTQIDNGGLDCNSSERLWANVCNRGASDVEAGVPGAFYDNDPRLGFARVLCTTMTVGPLAPGECEAVHCDLKDPPPGEQDLWFRADDDGKSANVAPECKRQNDLLFLPGYRCKNIG